MERESKHSKLVRLGFAASMLTAAGCSRGSVSNPVEYLNRTETPSASPTPFLPKETAVPFIESTPTPLPAQVEVSPILSNPYDFEGIRFDETGNPVTLGIEIDGEDGNATSFELSAKPENFREDMDIEEAFDAGKGTSFEYAFQSEALAGDIAHLVHSGRNALGQPLEAEKLRAYLEDTDVIRIWYRLSPEERQARIDSLMGARVSLRQGDMEVNDLEILDIVRIPPEKVPEFEENIDTFPIRASEVNPNIETYFNDNERQIYVVFCGWWTRGEEAPEGTRWYLWSRYVLVIGRP